MILPSRSIKRTPGLRTKFALIFIHHAQIIEELINKRQE